jgi:Raf kinase inhibitor-like YbhB/YbcL family protein
MAMMELHSSSFEDGQDIPQRHGKRGQNLSPSLSWEDPPAGTASFALAMVDKHPVARGYVHWLIADIDARANDLPEGAAGAALPRGSSEISPYAGPFPPSGTHDYELTLYALDTPRLDLPTRPTLEQFAQAVAPHTIETASLVGSFTR